MPAHDETQPQFTPPNSDPHATLDRPAGAALPGEIRIPGYDLQPEIAQGGMGVVYAARDLAFGREVAIKVMKPGMNATEFVREARITGRLPHPGIPPVYALGELPDGRPYLAMKLIRGDTLDTVLKRRTEFVTDRGRLLAAFEQMCHAVGYAHAQGIIHRDLKPSNVMVGAFGEVQVMDWGLAREVSSGQPTVGSEEQAGTPTTPDATDDALTTAAGQIKGTPAYMAPEQARGEPVDARADVFALGGILAAVLTGHPPFAGNSVMDTIIRAAQAELGETLARLDATGADAELLVLCKKCLAAKADDRYSDGTELAQAVAAYRAEVEARLIRQIEHERDKLAVFEYGGTMRVAHQEWRDNNLVAMRAILDGANPDLRGWEWRYLNKLCDPSLLTLKGHTSRVSAASFSPDGTRIVTGSFDKTAKVWDAQTGAEVLTLKGHANSVSAASFSADGTHIVTASGEFGKPGEAKVWDAQTGAEVLTLTGHTDAVTAATFSSDGTRIVTASGDQTAKVWDAKTDAEALALTGHTGNVYAASFSPDGTSIVTASRDNTAKVWDTRTGAEILTLTGHTHFVYASSFSADGTRIVTASGRYAKPGEAKVWDARTGAELLTLTGHTDAVTAASFSPDGTSIVTNSRDRSVRMWDAKTGAEVLILKWDAAYASYAPAVSFSPDGTRIVTVCGLSATVWDAKTGVELFTLKGPTGEKYAASFNADGTRIVTGNADKTAKVWDAQTGAEVLTLKGHTNAVCSASFSPDGIRIVTGSLDRTVKVWDAKTGAELLTLKGHADQVSAASFSADGTRILTASQDGTTKVWYAPPPLPVALAPRSK